MMNIKKLLSFLLILAMLATLGGCANPPEEAVESSDGGMTIVAGLPVPPMISPGR